jgi:hypothetical protein
MEIPLATLEHGKCKAEIFETRLPGSFSVRYCGADGSVLAEEPLTGVSTFRQREKEILERLDELCSGKRPHGEPLTDSGEYSA